MLVKDRVAVAHVVLVGFSDASAAAILNKLFDADGGAFCQRVYGGLQTC